MVEAVKAKRWRELARLSERDRALCTVAEKLSAQPTRMTKGDWQPLRELGFDDRACLEVTHVVGLFNYLTRLADGLVLGDRKRQTFGIDRSSGKHRMPLLDSRVLPLARRLQPIKQIAALEIQQLVIDRGSHALR